MSLQYMKEPQGSEQGNVDTINNFSTLSLQIWTRPLTRTYTCFKFMSVLDVDRNYSPIATNNNLKILVKLKFKHLLLDNLYFAMNWFEN